MANKSNGRFVHLIPILKKYKGYLWVGVSVTLVANSLMLIVPYLIKLAFDLVDNAHKSGLPLTESDQQLLLKYCLYMIGLSVVGGAFRFVMRRTIIWQSRKVEYDLRATLFKKWLALDNSYYDGSRTGEMMALATNDMEAVRMMVGPGIMHSFNASISTVVAICFMLTLSPTLTLATILPMSLLALSVNRLGSLVHKRFLVIQTHFAALTSQVQENMAGVRVIKAYRREDSETNSFGRMSKEYADLNLGMMRVYGLFHPMLFTIVGGVSLMVVYVGGQEVIAGTITLGTLVAFLGYLSWLVWPMMATGWVVSLYQRGMASLGRINKVLDAEPTVVDPGAEAGTEYQVSGKIEFKDLTFAYAKSKSGDAKPDNVLSNINLTIEPGTSLGITGPTGSGKSTLVSLIPRLYSAQPGMVFVDDRDVCDWPLEKLRGGVGFVPQETFLFSDTLEANINFSSRVQSEISTTEAARLAALDSEVESFPYKYETILGERGITLSGGQKQRTALARAIMKQPAILVLDDATSSVDTETEEKIFDSLEEVFPGRTSIVISHRVSSLKNCDLIIYLDKGQIVEQGNHDELLKLKGAYAGLYRLQLMEKELESM